MLFTTIYGKYLSRAVPYIWRVTREAENGVHAWKFGNDGMGYEEGRLVCGSSKNIATVASGVPSAKKSYQAVREVYFLGSTTGRVGAAMDCSLAIWGSDERSFQMLK